jgi:hypothetical protein
MVDKWTLSSHHGPRGNRHDLLIAIKQCFVVDLCSYQGLVILGSISNNVWSTQESCDSLSRMSRYEGSIDTIYS